jgi:hypothetical protein
MERRRDQFDQLSREAKRELNQKKDDRAAIR